MEKRIYQIEDVKRIKVALDKTGSVVYVLSTGGGKSHIVTMLVDDLVKEGKKILVLAHRRRLLQQLNDHFSKKSIEVGMMIASTEKNMDANVVVASVNTATRDNRLETLIAKGFDYIIVDEAHRIASDSYNNVLKQMTEDNPEVKLLGVTATPTRRDKKQLKDYFKEMILGIQIQDLIAQGYLADYVTYSCPVKDLDEEVEKNSNDYKRESLSAYMKNPERINYAVESYERYGVDKQMIIFCVDRSHAVEVLEAYKKAGYISAKILDSTLKIQEQEQILSEYENKTLDIIISIDMLNEGVDLPDTEVVQLLRPTMSLTVYMQQVGRGLRPKANGEKLIVLDNAGCSQEFGLVASPKNWSLDPNVSPTKPAEKNKVVAKLADGTYTENLMDAEFLELEEMSPEEYLTKVVGSVEKAEQMNKVLEAEIMAGYALIIQDLLKATKLADKWELTTRHLSADTRSFTLSEKAFKTDADISLEFQKDNDGVYTVLVKKSGWSSRETLENTANCYLAISDIIRFLLIPKNKQEFVTKFVVNRSKSGNLINIREMRSNVEELEKELKLKTLENILESGNNIINLGTTITMKDIYPSGGYWYSNKFTKLEFVKGRLLTANHIIFRTETGDEVAEIKSCKVDKIQEILNMKGVEINGQNGYKRIN